MGFRISGTLVISLVLLGGLLVFHWLERRRPMRPEATAGPGRRDYFADWVALIVNGLFLSHVSKIGAYYIVTSVPTAYTVLGQWPWLAQLALFLLVNDFARYWLHRWYHESDFLWRFHRVHHTATEMDSMSTFRVHVMEAVIKYGVVVMPFHVMGIDRWVIILYTCVDILKGFWHHANWKNEIGWLNYIFNSAELHWWHHSVEAKGQRANYGSIFSIWDWLFGTAYWPKGEWPGKIGVKGMDVFPASYEGMFASAALTDDALVERGHPGEPKEHPPVGEHKNRSSSTSADVAASA